MTMKDIEDDVGLLVPRLKSTAETFKDLLKRLSPPETFGHRMLMHQQCVLCYLMWLFRLSYLAWPETTGSPLESQREFHQPTVMAMWHQGTEPLRSLFYLLYATRTLLKIK